MLQSSSLLTRPSDSYPYISSSKSFVQPVIPTGHEANDDDGLDQVLDLSEEEAEIDRLTKLIEPDYLYQTLEPTVTEVNLKSAISDSAQEIRNLRKPLESLENVAAELAEFTKSNEEANDILEQIDQHARRVIGDIQLLEFRKDELEQIRERVHRSSRSSNQSINLHDELCKKLSTRFSEWNSLSLRQKFAQNSSYKNFRQRIWEASGAKEIMPHLKTYLPADPGEAEEDESSGDELEIGGATQNYKCPLCISFLKVPLVSQLCRHAFCKACFEEYLSQNGSDSVPCPATGCSKLLNSHFVRADDSLAARVRQFLRREQSRQDETNFEDEASTQGDPIVEEDSKPTRLARAKASASQRRRRVVVDDD